MTASVKSRLERKATRYHALKDQARAQREELDDLIVEARAGDMTFREIATHVGLSVAWVQNAVGRVAERPKK